MGHGRVLLKLQRSPCLCLPWFAQVKLSGRGNLGHEDFIYGRKKGVGSFNAISYQRVREEISANSFVFL